MHWPWWSHVWRVDGHSHGPPPVGRSETTIGSSTARSRRYAGAARRPIEPHSRQPAGQHAAAPRACRCARASGRGSGGRRRRSRSAPAARRVMSNGSSPTASGSVFAGGLSRCSVVPAGISRPSKVMSSTARRVVHTTVGFQRITSSTAFAASSGRSARRRPLAGALDEELQGEPELVLGRVHPAEDDQRDHRPQLRRASTRPSPSWAATRRRDDVVARRRAGARRSARRPGRTCSRGRPRSARGPPRW